ncbi:erythromycin esterase family protein [Naumannella cuiyingiana]|uniref:Erythromycin esterase n=1 Tax=Naumannella cuiyingiana TaxID=1347891 RepID=A0A7Z0IM69_9ACTN|nr:erythromycin esterase family protein [Naumannella cuiyingiana]NYI72318.1 erythromycin esterase [Naumannella cuiyingiana]
MITKRLLAATVITATLLFGGCTAAPTADFGPAEFGRYVTPLDDLALPAAVDGARLVGMGEATHGNTEFLAAKQAVFAELATEHGYRVFAIEGDFGGAAAVNAYVRDGSGSAQEAVSAIGFPIYRTRELVAQVEWIRDFNTRAKAGDKISFYGVDFQRYDRNKDGLASNLSALDPGFAKEAEEALAPLTDAKFRGLDDEQQRSAAAAARTVLDTLVAREQRYAETDRAAYDLARQYATIIWQGAEWRASGADSNLRDAFMADNVGWVLDREPGRRAFLSGHNGHVLTTPYTFTPTGALLRQRLGDDYYAIGTDVVNSTFTMAGVRGSSQASISNGAAKEWARLFGEKEPGFVDFASASADPAVAAFLREPRAMTNVGNEVVPGFQFLPFTYTITLAPAESYDALVFVADATPTTLLPPS